MTTLHQPRKHRFVLLVLAVLLSLAAAPALLADDDDDDGGGTSSSTNRCAIKFVCGDTDLEDRAVGGSYRTAINILNAGTETVNYSKQIALTTPADDEVPETPGDTFGPIDGSLGSLLAFDVDCNEIFNEFGASGPFAEGFLILTSDGPLDVTAVYTAGDGEAGVNSIDVEQVECAGGSSGGGDDDDDGGGDDDD